MDGLGRKSTIATARVSVTQSLQKPTLRQKTIAKTSVQPKKTKRPTKPTFIVPLFAPKAPHQLLQKFSLMRRRARVISKRAKIATAQRLRKQLLFPKYALLITGLVMIVSFAGGVYLEWSSKQSSAYVSGVAQVLGVEESANQSASESFFSADQAVDTFIEAMSATGDNAETSEYITRKQNLHRYLKSKGSPLARDDKALDALLHAKNMHMVLAISFVESNFCEHYVDYNCSGIGVEPGHPSWQVYKSFANWVIGLDSLIERRYKNWTPEEMRGVYVYPGSDNWVNGVNDVLAELKKANIQ